MKDLLPGIGVEVLAPELETDELAAEKVRDGPAETEPVDDAEDVEPAEPRVWATIGQLKAIRERTSANDATRI